MSVSLTMLRFMIAATLKAALSSAGEIDFSKRMIMLLNYLLMCYRYVRVGGGDGAQAGMERNSRVPFPFHSMSSYLFVSAYCI